MIELHVEVLMAMVFIVLIKRMIKHYIIVVRNVLLWNYWIGEDLIFDFTFDIKLEQLI